MARPRRPPLNQGGYPTGVRGLRLVGIGRCVCHPGVGGRPNAFCFDDDPQSPPR